MQPSRLRVSYPSICKSQRQYSNSKKFSSNIARFVLMSFVQCILLAGINGVATAQPTDYVSIYSNMTGSEFSEMRPKERRHAIYVMSRNSGLSYPADTVLSIGSAIINGTAPTLDNDQIKQNAQLSECIFDILNNPQNSRLPELIFRVETTAKRTTHATTSVHNIVIERLKAMCV